MAGARPVAWLAAAASSRAGLLSACLYLLAVAGLLALPLAGKAIYHDENALLVGHAESVIRKGTTVRSGQAFASQLLQQLRKSSRGNHADAASESIALQATAMRAAADRMQQLGLEVYWQPFSSGSGSNRAGRSIANRFARLSGGNDTGKADDAAGGDAGSSGVSSGGFAAAGGCVNLHGVLRSPRGDGKEGLVLATPLALAAPSDDRPGWRQGPSGAAEALGLASAVAQHLAGAPWLAKDFVWLVPDARCGLLPSMEAWLAHYQDGTTCSAALGSGPGANRTGSGAPAFGRAGQLQQAVVLQASGVAGEATPAEGGGGDGGSIFAAAPDGETEAASQRRAEAAKTLTAPLVGAAGQLPKLDLFYLFRRYLATHGGGLQIDIKPEALRPPRTLPAALLPRRATDHAAQLWAGALFAAQQAAGLPTAPHAAFKPYAIDAVTVQLPTPAPGLPEAKAGHFIARLAPALELTFRSLNGLLERFHHSYFLYVLLSPDRFVTVEAYLLPVVTLLLALALQAAAAAGGAPFTGSGVPLSWPAALYTVAGLHAGPAAVAFAVHAAFQPAGCNVRGSAQTATQAASSGGSSGSSSWQLRSGLAVGSANSVAAAAAACVLATVAWRHARLAPAKSVPLSSDHGVSRTASGGGGSGGGGGNSMLSRAAEAAWRFRAALAGSGWRRLKAALLTCTVLQLSVVACIDWAAAAAALVMLVPWLCAARPLPLGRRDSSVAERGSFLGLALLSPWSVVSALGGLAAARNGMVLANLLHDVTGERQTAQPAGLLTAMATGAQSILRLLAASPVLAALLLGVWAPAWLCCALIAVAPSDS